MEKSETMMFSNRSLKRLIWPLVVEQLLAVTIGMADTVMVASCGEAAVSGVSLVDSINILLINVFSALATGGAIVASQYLGRDDLENANLAARQLLLSVGFLSALSFLSGVSSATVGAARPSGNVSVQPGRRVSVTETALSDTGNGKSRRLSEQKGSKDAGFLFLTVFSVYG